MASGLRSVVKHSYLTGKSQGVGRAKAHVRYIQFRAGKDKDEEPRAFFNNLRDDITGRDVATSISDQDPRGTVMHKLILSPGVQGADVKEYCREVMADLSSKKGLDLEWYAVQHDNTNNPHVHIVVMGKDQRGHRVKLGREDYTKIKETGDKYLERNRHLDREDKDKEKDQDKEERGPINPVTRFVDALRAAAQAFSRGMEREERDAGGEKKPESKFEKRRREKEEERQRESDALGDAVDLDAYLAKEARKEEREDVRKKKAWKEYCKPIEIDRGAHEPIKYDRSSSIGTLRQLEKDYKNEDPRVREGMTEKDAERLNDWIREKYRDEKRIEQKAEKLQGIDVELDAETSLNWSSASSLEDLRKLEDLNARGEVYLDDAERKALSNWIKDHLYKEPIKIELEAGSEPVVYDRDDSKESLQFLAKEYEKGEHWATKSLSNDDYKKVKGWISDKDKPKDAEKNPEKDRVLVGKTEGGKNRYVAKSLDSDSLRQAREDLSNRPGASKEDLKLLDSWIEAKEKEENKDPNKKPYVQRRKRTAREKLMDRELRQDRAARFDNYFKEKAEHRARIEAQKANLKGQKRALDQVAKERETVDGEYSAKFGAEHSAISTGGRGAAATGLRPLGANQFMQLLAQAGSKHKELKDQREKAGQAGEKQRELEKQKEPDKGQEKLQEKEDDIKKAERGESQAERFDRRDRVDVVSELHDEKNELEKDVKGKKEEERKRSPNREKGKDDDDYFFGGR